MKPNKAVVYMVVGTLAFAVLLYAGTLTFCSTRNVQPPDAILTAFKDLAIFASGALAALLARTGNASDSPTETKIVTDKGAVSKDNPLPTDPQHPL